MKTSNRLLLGAIAVIVFYVTAAFIELRIKGDDFAKTTSTQTMDIPLFNHLVLRELDQRVNVKFSDAPSFGLMDAVPYSFEAINYEMRGDTLIVHDLGEANEGQRSFVIETGNNLQSLTSEKGSYTLRGFSLDSLQIQQRGGAGAISDCRKLNYLDLSVTRQGEFDVYDSQIEGLKLYMKSGNVELRSSVVSLSGSMVDRSYLSLSGAQNFQFQKDETSRLRMYD